MQDLQPKTILLLLVFVTMAAGTEKCKSWRDCEKCEHPLLDRYCDNHECACVVNQGKRCVREEDCNQCPVTLERSCSAHNHCLCRPKPNVDLMHRYCKKWFHCEFCPRHYFRVCVNNDCVCEALNDKCHDVKECKICREPFEGDCGHGGICLCRPQGYAELQNKEEVVAKV